MNWNDCFWLLQGEPAAQAALLSLAWNEAAQSGNAALLSNLHCNMLNPNGVCMVLDAAGVPVPPESLPLLPKSLRA
jgi:hypothetical protein